MARTRMAIEDLQLRSFQVWDKRWFLLTSGNYAEAAFNTMTVSWGSLGTIWNRPFAQVVVRPTRYTYRFMERFDTFTLSGFSEAHREALQLLGTRSGKGGDKIAASGLTPEPSLLIEAPGFVEADIVIECRKIYWDDLEPSRFLDASIAGNYPEHDYHRIYFGEVVAVTADPRGIA